MPATKRKTAMHLPERADVLQFSLNIHMSIFQLINVQNGIDQFFVFLMERFHPFHVANLLPVFLVIISIP